jgi:thioredoxin-related protein
MRPHLRMSLFVLAAILCRGNSMLAEEVKWVASANKAWETMAREKRPLLIYVTMPNCPYCTLMQEQIYHHPQIVQEINKSFVSVTLDGAEAQELVQSLGITIFPTTIVISPEKKVLLHIKGYLPADQFKQRLATAAKKESKMTR